MEQQSPSANRAILGVAILAGMFVVVGGLIAAGIVAFVVLVLQPNIEASRETTAKAQVKTIDDAVTRFYLRTGDYPFELQVLTEPNDENGGTPSLPREAVIDPWGKLYRFEPEGFHHEGEKPDIYTVTPQGKVIGNWNK